MAEPAAKSGIPSSLRPKTADQVCEIVRWAAAEGAPVEVLGHGSKRGLGRAMQTEHTIDLSALSGVKLYEPEELVLSAQAGTPIAEIEKLLAEHGQEFAFEPADLGPLLGGQPGRATLGGVLACNLSGPRRIKAGAARDHFLGVDAVTGRGELVKSGGRVVKNVTGYDLCKLFAGSHGTLAVMTDVTVKVLPAGQKQRTVLVYGLDAQDADRAMSAALQSPYEVSAAAHLPAALAGTSGVDLVRDPGEAVTAIRLEGFGPSVEYRCRKMRDLLAVFGATEELHSQRSATLWKEVRDVKPLVGGDDNIWRLSVPPMSGADVAGRIAAAVTGTRAFYDWGGGLVWLALPPADDAHEAVVRGALRDAGVSGHALLVRAPAAVRAVVSAFQPQDPATAALTARLKESFDPKGVLNPGRMYAGV
ncbi:MAG: FAD-binding protein [Alphaproteobacteria bacterium]|nr:FAD-binding protein [Alphaproteobacteria bacterium]